MITIKIVHNWKKRCKPNEDAPLDFRIIINRKPYYLATGVKVKASEFVCGKVVNRPDADVLNDILGHMSEKAYAELGECMREGRSIAMADLKKQLWKVHEDKSDAPTFLDWIAEQLPLMRMKEGTLRHYRTVEARLHEFGQFQKWADLTTANIYMWDGWLHQLRRTPSENEKNAGVETEFISQATVHVYHKCLKALINRAVKFGIIPSNPYDRLRGEFSRGERENIEFLTEEEMKVIMSLHPLDGTKMAHARDLFVFQMFTGLSYSDAEAFDISQYKRVDGKWVHNGTRIKTGKPYISQLLQPAIEVLEKYGMKTPKINNSDYNVCLKALGYAVGIATPLHSHLARHTFATYMLRNGVKLENLQKMLGHTNIIQTQRYAKVLAQSVHEDFDLIAEKLK
jgi:integrase